MSTAGLIVVGTPIAAICVAAVVIHFVDSRWVVRVSTASIALQLSLTIAALLVRATLPEEQNWRERPGSTCPVLDGVHGEVLATVAYGSVGVAAVALVSSVVSVSRGVASPARAVAGVVAAGLVVAIFATWVTAAFCGLG